MNASPAQPSNAELDAIVTAVDAILAAVETSLSTPAVEDEAQSFLVSAYGRAYRCMRAIRELAAPPRADADHALVLTRSLVSTIARSLWLAAPEHGADRAYRFLQWQYRYALDERFTLVDLCRQGFEPEPEILGKVRAAVRRMKEAGIEPMPGDRQLLKVLGLAPLYARVHRLGSDITHFSLGSAVDGFLDPVTPGMLEGRSVALQHPQPDRAAYALALAAISYGAFLEKSEPLIGHGVTELARQLVEDWVLEYGG